MRLYVILDRLLDICKTVALMLDKQFQELLNRLGLHRGEIAHFLILCNVC